MLALLAGPGAVAPGVLPALAGEWRSPADLIALLKTPGAVALMRHALAPIDPNRSETPVEAEELGPCATQRNLDDVGRADARRIGELLRAQGVVFERVFTSRWCRCRETAELIRGGPVEHLPFIDSYFQSPTRATRGPAQLAGLRHFIGTELPKTDRVLMVTHGSVIHDLTMRWTDESEMVVFRADGRGGVDFIAFGSV
jgi:phosphohistidine phosphatase SixA